MTAQQRYGADMGYSAHNMGAHSMGAHTMGAQYDRRAGQRMDSRSRGAQTASARGSAEPMYIYGDRVCPKGAKQRQLYKKYGAAAGYGEGMNSRSGGRAQRGAPMGRGEPKKRYKIVMENIINIFESIEERRRNDVETAKRNAIMRKKFLEHRRGFFLALFMIAFLVAFVLLVYNLFFGIGSIYAENTVNYTEAEIIAASGVVEGDKLYSFRADEVENRITFFCPYIKSVDVTRKVPNKIDFAVESDKGVYYADIYGERLVLSGGLRVLGEFDPAVHGGLTELCLPEVDYSVAGRLISFADEKQERFVRDTLGLIGRSGLSGRVGMADLRDAYSMVIYCDGLYLLKVGGEKDLAYKLKMAEKTIGDPDFNQGIPAEIDLTVLGEASVRYDHTITTSADNRG
ncbi:MAG: FtsQ-type POTRA domain-containing protein [Ruminococcaceae bacterium]|nr:FtsQ-type POTRA domain-containing protein [Oscillospiraceae bacterium]